MGRSRTLPLFDDPPVTAPEGFAYHPAVIDEAAERVLLTHVRALEFGDVVMRGVTARRRVVQFGWRYSFDARALTEGPAVPDYLRQLQGIAGALADVEPGDLSEVLVTEYPAGATIGWHRDAPPFGIVVGVSLLSACRFRFRRTANDRVERADLELAPRSAFVLRGAARTEWQHSIPPTTALRYSITFRTLRRAANGGRRAPEGGRAAGDRHR
jgi:alkylated DNA repair protein (DNA oxidative demethylase)